MVDRASPPRPPGPPSDFEKLGGEPALRAIIDRFVDRVMDDMMIGFLFARVNRARLKQLEYEFAATHLGAEVPYTGRPLDVAHERHPILGGQFNRRLKILERTLAELKAPPDVAERWLAHNEALRPLITQDASSECDPTRAAEWAASATLRRKVGRDGGSHGEHGS